jgi:hypothetical protein
MAHIATLTLPQPAGGSIMHLSDGDDAVRPFVWSSSDASLGDVVAVANELSNPPSYDYSPADGHPGRQVAVAVHVSLGGVLSFPDLPEGEPHDPDNPKVY